MLLGAPLPLAGQRIVERAERLSDTYERVLAGEESRDNLPHDLLGEVSQLADRLDAHLEDHPEDVRGLIAAAGLAYTRVILTLSNIRWSPASGEKLPELRPVRAHARLTRALAIEPDNAEAHYWQARLYGLHHPHVRDGVFVTEPEDLGRAISHARRAVELAPVERLYREALAGYLIGDHRFDDAAEVVRDLDGGQHAFYLLLMDMKAVPLPPSVVYSPLESRGFAEFLLNRNRFEDHGFLRARVYGYPGPLADIEAFYRDSFPDIRLFEPGSEGSSTLHFRTIEGGLEPSDEQSDGYEENRLSILIHELSEDDASRQKYGLTGEGPFCVIYIINMRKIGGR